MVNALRERVKLASQIRPRNFDELREEERTVIYREVLNLLIEDEISSELYSLSERIRSIFDLDRLFYFVAPDWWKPSKKRISESITYPSKPWDDPSRDRVGFTWTSEAETLDPQQRVLYG